MTVGPLEQDERTRRRTIPRCRATGRRTAGRVTPEPSYSGSPKLGHRAFCERRFPTRGARGVWRRRGRGIAGNTGQLPRVGERAKDPCAHLIGCPARAIRSSPIRGAQHSADWGKRSRFLAKGKRLFPRSLCNADHTNFCQIAAKRKKSQKTAQPAVRMGSEKVTGLSALPAVGGVFPQVSNRFPTSNHRLTDRG